MRFWMMVDVCITIFECRLSTEECRTKQVDTLDRVNVSGDWMAKVKQDNHGVSWAVLKCECGGVEVC